MGLLVCGILIVTIISLYIVNMPAMFDCMVLSNNSSANIGSAIGGVSALIVGIANVVMLYLTFGSQMKTFRLQEEEMAQHTKEQKKTEEFQNKSLEIEKEKNATLIEIAYKRNEEVFRNNGLNNLVSTWTRLFSMEKNDNSKEAFDKALVFNMKIFLSSLEVVDDKLHLKGMRDIFDTYIRYFYSVRCYDGNSQFMEEYKAIEKKFNEKRV